MELIQQLSNRHNLHKEDISIKGPSPLKLMLFKGQL